mgnify:CR=1 FL=1
MFAIIETERDCGLLPRSIDRGPGRYDAPGSEHHEDLSDADVGLGVLRVERVLRVDEGRDATLLLHVRNGVQGQCGLSGGFGAVDLDNPAAWDAADTEGDVQAQGAGRN